MGLQLWRQGGIRGLAPRGISRGLVPSIAYRASHMEYQKSGIWAEVLAINIIASWTCQHQKARLRKSSLKKERLDALIDIGFIENDT